MEIGRDFPNQEKKKSKFSYKSKNLNHDKSTIKIINNFTNFHTNKNNIENNSWKDKNCFTNFANLDHKRSSSYNSEYLKNSVHGLGRNYNLNLNQQNNAQLVTNLKNTSRKEESESDDSLKINKYSEPKITIETFFVDNKENPEVEIGDEEINFDDLIFLKSKMKNKEYSLSFEFV